MENKRKATDGTVAISVKKARHEISLDFGGVEGVPRTSHLLAPIMLLAGHEGDLNCTKFSPTGQFLASAGNDRQIFLWSIYGECENIEVMTGHTGAIMDLHFNTDGSQIVTCSTDKMLALWDCSTGTRTRKYRGHQSFVNTCDIARRGPQILCSASDDCTVRIWDSRRKLSLQTLQNTYQVTTVCFSDTAEQVITGGIDNDLKVWDLRKNAVLYQMSGHSDTVTGMELSPDGSYLLTTAMDNTELTPRRLESGRRKVAAGSGDRFVYIWDTTSRRILYKLPGHAGSVNEVDFHPFEPIIASCSSDKRIYLGEIE